MWGSGLCPVSAPHSSTSGTEGLLAVEIPPRVYYPMLSALSAEDFLVSFLGRKAVTTCKVTQDFECGEQGRSQDVLWRLLYSLLQVLALSGALFISIGSFLSFYLTVGCYPT